MDRTNDQNLNYGSDYSSCDGLQVGNLPIQDFAGNLALFAYDSNREKLEKFRSNVEEEEAN